MLDTICVAARDAGAAADVLIARAFAARRYAGAKDRRAIRELVYAAIRCCGERPVSGRAAMLALVRERPELAVGFDGSPYGPAAIAAEEPVAVPGIAPAWLVAALMVSGLDAPEQAALLARAPLDLRVNQLRPLAEPIPEAESLAFVPDALRLPADSRIETLPAFQQGRIEVQDAGSQLVTMSVAPQPGMAVVDLCAGGGGKTLALAALMANRGTILACDVDRARLERLPPRAARAGVTIATTRLLDPGRERERLTDWFGQADRVLVDAPCSGTGTWRRNPESRWRLTPERLARIVATQRHVLEVAAALVKPGGSLHYVVCSLLDAEGAEQLAWFAHTHPDWRIDPLALGAGVPHLGGMRLTPARDSTDGFFAAALTRSC